MSDRAVPYYYGYRKNRPLHQFWNFDLALRCMSHLVPGYNAAKYEDKPAPEHVVNPLNFNLDGYNFLRIEGHIGQKIDAAFTVISDTIEQKNLPVDLMKVKMSTGNEDINVHFGCESEDLQLFYVTMCSELACLLKKEITYFSDLKYTEPRPEFEAGEISITGTVRDEKNNKLQGAQVTLQEKSLTVVTNEKGAFTIPKPGEEPATPITAGKYTLTISKGGFKTEKIAIELKTGHVLKQDIQLSTLRYYNPFEFEYAGTKLDKLTGSLYYPGTQSPGLGTAATTTTNPVPGSGVLTTPGTAIYSGSTGTPGITGSIGTTGGISSEVSGGLPMYSGVAGSERRAGSSMYTAAVAGTSTYLSGTAAAAASASQLAGQSQVLTGTAIQAEAGVKQDVFGTGKFLEYSLGGVRRVNTPWGIFISSTYNRTGKKIFTDLPGTILVRIVKFCRLNYRRFSKIKSITHCASLKK